MEQTVVALFDTYDEAINARKELLNAGFSGGEVDLLEQRPGTAHAEKAEGGGFFDRMRQFFVPEDREYLEEAARRGGTLLTVHADEKRLDRALGILQRHNPVDLDRRAEEWRRAGWQGRTAEAPGKTSARGERGEKIPVVEEKLEVGKKREVRGGVRIYSRITEIPVQEDVTLREERVDMERQRADRPAGPEEMRERTVEMTETREEPVVRKEARVVEEIILRKDVQERTETVKEKVRKTDVEVEQLDKEFRRDFEQRFAGRGYTYEQSQAAYSFGRDMAHDPRFRGKRWEAIEPEARRLFEERNPGMWNEYKDAVRSAFDRTQGRKAA